MTRYEILTTVYILLDNMNNPITSTLPLQREGEEAVLQRR